MKTIIVTLVLLLGAGWVSATEPVSSRDVRRMIQSGDEAAIDQLLKDGVNFIDVQQAGGRSDLSALELAAYFEQTGILKQLLAKQPQLAARYGSKALQLACATNIKNKEIIEALMGAGVDINAKNTSGKNCLYSAAVAADPEFFDYLLTLGADAGVKVSPHEWLHIDADISIERFVAIRLERHQQMMRDIVQRSQ